MILIHLRGNSGCACCIRSVGGGASLQQFVARTAPGFSGLQLAVVIGIEQPRMRSSVRISSDLNSARERGVTVKLHAFLLFLFLSPAFSQEAKVPLQFEDFPATEGPVGRPAAPVLRSHSHKMFQYMIRHGAKLPANFAGRYRIIEWGCGSPCSSYVVVDQKTGEVYDLPFESFSSLDFECPEPYDNCLGDGLIFKPNSRLLIADGYGDSTGRFGRFYYEWKNHRFKLIRADIKKHDEE